jgi:xanthine dehydrogenase molybdenum-binding subunit
VEAILTAQISGEHNAACDPDWPTMVLSEHARKGKSIAIVAAESREIASQAIDSIEVDFELLPVISDAVQARREDVPALHPKGNLLKHIKVRKGNVAQGFSESDVILEHTFTTAITEHAFIEP